MYKIRDCGVIGGDKVTTPLDKDACFERVCFTNDSEIADYFKKYQQGRFVVTEVSELEPTTLIG